MRNSSAVEADNSPDTPLRLNMATAIAWRRPTEAEMAFRDAVNATGGLLRLLQGSVQ